LNLVQDELKLRRNTKAYEIARDFANTIQKAIDSGLILQGTLDPDDYYTPSFTISNNDGCKLYLIRPMKTMKIMAIPYTNGTIRKINGKKWINHFVIKGLTSSAPYDKIRYTKK
jgi:hypothetical protein